MEGQKGITEIPGTRKSMCKGRRVSTARTTNNLTRLRKVRILGKEGIAGSL